MSGPIDPTTITAIGAFTALSSAVADYLALDPEACTGLGGPVLRVEDDEDAPAEDGNLIFPRLDGGWVVTLVGDILATSTGFSSEAGYRAAVRAVMVSLKSALDSLKAAPGDLTHSGGTEKVWFHSAIDPTWTSFHTCRVTFGVIVDAFA